MRPGILVFLCLLLATQSVWSSQYEEGLPPVAYDPWFSALLIRILLATNPDLLAYALSQRPQPKSFDGLARRELFYSRRELKYLPYTDNVANSKPFGAYKHQNRWRLPFPLTAFIRHLQNPRTAQQSHLKTPLSENIPSPAEILFKRKLAGLLPNQSDFSQTNANLEIQTKLKERQLVQKQYFDRQTKPLSNLYPGQKVLYRDRNTNNLSPAKVVSSSLKPRAYIIETETDRTLERNRKHLFKDTNNPSLEENNSDHDLPTPKETEIGKNLTETNKYTTRSGRTVKRPIKFKDYVQ